eukprot:Amastigsp_a340673_55.p4 type:complete len:102 gc:universal Amastigsp_a340673_55:1001-1306(+)
MCRLRWTLDDSEQGLAVWAQSRASKQPAPRIELDRCPRREVHHHGAAMNVLFVDLARGLEDHRVCSRVADPIGHIYQRTEFPDLGSGSGFQVNAPKSPERL